MGPERPGLVFFIKAFCAGVIILAVWFTAFVVGPRIETALFPVVGYLEITRVEGFDNGKQSRIWVQFEKLRECKPIEVHWYRGHRKEIFERVNFYVEKPVGGMKYTNRPLGLQKSGPWVVAVPPEEVRSNTFADAEHSCWPGWDTRSRFYPKPAEPVPAQITRG